MMLDLFVLFGFCGAVWYFVKQTARTLERPDLWDWAEPVTGIAGAVGAAYISYPIVMHYNGPLVSVVYRALAFAAFVTLMALMISAWLEEEGRIRTPEGLARPKVRLIEGIVTVGEE